MTITSSLRFLYILGGSRLLCAAPHMTHQLCTLTPTDDYMYIIYAIYRWVAGGSDMFLFCLHFVLTKKCTTYLEELIVLSQF